MSTTKRPGSTLLALTASALCLPGYSGSAQAWAEPEVQTGYRYSHYSESDLPATDTTTGNGERYEVQSHQFHLLVPQGETLDYNVNLVWETMSGASPWYVMPNVNRMPVQVMSGATIDDERLELTLKGRRYRESGREALSVGVSSEKDYRSISGGIETETEFNGRRSTFTAGAGYSYDRLEPTDGASARFPARIAADDKESSNAYLGLSHVLGIQTIAQVGVSFTYANGLLSDPYKLAWVDSLANTVADTRPSHRAQWTGSARLRHFMPGANAALHFDYRHFGDSWGIVSDTTEVSWHQNLPGDFSLVPSVRWYQQGAADFYRNFYLTPTADNLYSSDYRLSAFGAFSGRLELSKKFQKLSLFVSAEIYDSQTSYSLHETAQANPGLVDFTVLSASFSYRF